MSGLGHFAAGFAAKPSQPKVPLGVLLVASEANDILYFLFTATGLEKPAQVAGGFTQGLRYLDATTNPWSHGLFMSVVWSLVAAGLAFAVYRQRRTALILGLVVLSHWGLDFLMHANLPLFFAGSPVVGLGLETTGPGFIVMTLLDLALLGAALTYYFRHRRAQRLGAVAGQN